VAYLFCGVSASADDNPVRRAGRHLIGLGRMSSDGEITAMRAAGIPSQKVIRR
jgi:hypothetical protein